MAENVAPIRIDAPFPLTPGYPHAMVSVSHSDSKCVNYNTTKVEVMVAVPCDPTAQAIGLASAWASETVQLILSEQKQLVGGTFAGEQQIPRVAASAPASLPPPPANTPPPQQYGGILRQM